MIRISAALCLLLVSPLAVIAQETPPPEIVINPGATINQSSKQANMLTGFYATKATIELCALTLDPAIVEGMNADQKRLEAALAMDPATAEKGYAQVKAEVEKTTPDCTEGSPDRLGVDAVTAIYSALPGAAAAPEQTSAADPVAPAAEPADPAPAQ